MTHLSVGFIKRLYLLTLLRRGLGGFLGIPDFLETGVCVEVPSMKNFDPEKYQGLWFDIRRVPNEYQRAYKCISQNYTWTGFEIDVISRGITKDGAETIQTAVMAPDDNSTVPSAENKALMYVDAKGVPRAPYQVIWTNYVSTACVYSCMDYGQMFRAEFLWIISRNETPSETSLQKCLDLFTVHGIDVNKVMVVEQGETCGYGEYIEDDRNKTQDFLNEIRRNMSVTKIQSMNQSWKENLATETMEDWDEFLTTITVENSTPSIGNGAERSKPRTGVMLTVLVLALLMSYITV